MKRTFFYVTFLSASILLGNSCSKDDAEEPTFENAGQECFHPTQIMGEDSEDKYPFKFTYDADRRLTRFRDSNWFDETVKFTYDPLTMSVAGSKYENFTFDEKGRVTSFQEKLDESDSEIYDKVKYELKYEGNYLVRYSEIKSYIDGDISSRDMLLKWSEGNLMKIEQSSSSDSYTYEREFKYSSLPAYQLPICFILDEFSDGIIEYLYYADLVGYIPKNLISASGDSTPDSWETYSFTLNPNGSIKEEIWCPDDDDPIIFTYTY